MLKQEAEGRLFRQTVCGVRVYHWLCARCEGRISCRYLRHLRKEIKEHIFRHIMGMDIWEGKPVKDCGETCG